MNTSARTLHRTRIAFVLAAATLTVGAGCASYGVRANANGECPSGEVCSDLAPQGAAFTTPIRAGMSLSQVGGSASPLTPVAVGGSMEVGVHLRTGRRVDPSLVTARSSDGAVFEATGGLPSARVRGLAPGGAMLRIEERATGALLDMIRLESVPVARVEVSPPQLGGTGDESLFTSPGSWVERTTPLRWKLFIEPGLAPSPTTPSLPLAVTLRAADGRSVIDEGMTVTAEGDAATAETVRWDSIAVRPQREGTLRVRAVVGGVSHEAVIETATAVDGLRPAAFTSQEGDAIDASGLRAAPVEAGEGFFVCFEATRGDAVLYGVPLRVRASDGLSLDGSSTRTTRTPCIGVSALAEGERTVTAEYGSHSATVRLRVTPATRMRAASAPWAEQALREEGEAPEGAALGVRAQGE